jgi:AcrR family transcriptional regulator
MAEKRERSYRAGPLRVRVTTEAREERPAKPRLTRERIVEAAMRLMAEQGYDGVSMRSLARALDTAPASLYAHVANREEVDQLVVDRISHLMPVPEPDPDRWQDQLKQMMRDALALYRAHPGSARAAMGVIPLGEGGVRAAEAMVRLCLAGGVTPQAAAWFCDLMALYVGAIAYEEEVWAQRENTTGAGEAPDPEALDRQLADHFASLSRERYPAMAVLAAVMASGDGEERFEFGIYVRVSGLAAAPTRSRRPDDEELLAPRPDEVSRRSAG